VYLSENGASAHFIWALLLSFVLHVLGLTLLHPLKFSSNKPVTIIDVELSPPPAPVAPPPEPPKSKVEPPKLAPPIKRLPQPVRTEPPPPAAVAPAEVVPEPVPRVEPVPPPLISVPQKPVEQPTFVAPPPPQEPPKKLVTQDMDAARGYYSSQLGREFAKHKDYPRLARMRGWQGTVQVKLQVDATGAVISSSISKSSGHDVLDKQALEMVQKALPLPRPPEALRDQEFTVLVPVDFRLE
jgi:protein TonB